MIDYELRTKCFMLFEISTNAISARKCIKTNVLIKQQNASYSLISFNFIAIIRMQDKDFPMTTMMVDGEVGVLPFLDAPTNDVVTDRSV